MTVVQYEMFLYKVEIILYHIYIIFFREIALWKLILTGGRPAAPCLHPVHIYVLYGSESVEYDRAQLWYRGISFKMSQSFLNKHVKALIYLDETISSSRLKRIVSEYDKIVESLDIFNYNFKFYNGYRIIMIT